MKHLLSFLLFLSVLTIGACESYLSRIKLKYPQCDITAIEQTSDEVKVLVQCPNRDPFVRTYRRQD
jgi:hypothetical protein